MTPHAVAKRIGQIYLVYLCILPAAGTFVLLGVLHVAIWPLVFFFVGTAVVAIYLGMVASYTKLSDKPFRNLLLFLDGPIWIAPGTFFGGSIATAIVEDVLVETISMLIGIFGLTMVSRLPTPRQRVSSFLVVGIPLIGVLVILFLYAQQYVVPENPWRLLFIIGATLQGTITQFRTVQKDEVMRSSEGYILIGIGAWIVALAVGNVMRELSLQ